MALIISQAVREKLLTKHGIKDPDRDVMDCFASLGISGGGFLEDTKEEHKTDPATLWFIGQTMSGRLLKVVFVPKDGNTYLKTAFYPKQKHIDAYTKMGFSCNFE